MRKNASKTVRFKRSPNSSLDSLASAACLPTLDVQFGCAKMRITHTAVIAGICDSCLALFGVFGLKPG
jgi:hypothetical protein